MKESEIQDAVRLALGTFGLINDRGDGASIRGGLVGAVNDLPLVWPVAARASEHLSNAGAD